jgi:hypothetical protein
MERLFRQDPSLLMPPPAAALRTAVSRIGRHAPLSACLVSVTLVVACGPALSIPSELVEPEVAGEIEDASFVHGTTATIDVVLVDGRTIRIDLDEADGHGRQPTDSGLLLLYGTRKGEA